MWSVATPTARWKRGEKPLTSASVAHYRRRASAGPGNGTDRLAYRAITNRCRSYGFGRGVGRLRLREYDHRECENDGVHAPRILSSDRRPVAPGYRSIPSTRP